MKHFTFAPGNVKYHACQLKRPNVLEAHGPKSSTRGHTRGRSFFAFSWNPASSGRLLTPRYAPETCYFGASASIGWRHWSFVSARVFAVGILLAHARVPTDTDCERNDTGLHTCVFINFDFVIFSVDNFGFEILIKKLVWCLSGWFRFINEYLKHKWFEIYTEINYIFSSVVDLFL